MTGVYTVTQINSYIKNLFRQDFVLKNVKIRGEIWNCKYHTSGHIYFTLKDEDSALNAIMFKTNANNLSFRLEDGLAVEVTGRIDIYERDGKYQIYAESIEKTGIGDLNKKYQELFNMYEEMGYFDQGYKRPIPKYAKRIGIVTASTGAAIRDIITVSKRRNKYVDLILFPALVQGDKAKYSIVDGINTLDKLGLDCIIVGRGGGSMEDLWAFNEPEVVEAIFNANTPIISAVGHEVDFTLADWVADLRAPTPSAAAELAVCDISEVINKIDSMNRRINLAFNNTLRAYKDNLDKLSIRLKTNDPAAKLDKNREDLIKLEDELNLIMNNKLKEYTNNLKVLATKLEGQSPLKKLSSGYSYVDNNGLNVSSIDDVEINDTINIYVKDGTISAVVGGKHGREYK
ncbi:exodeoxyribonuclease VII large subunit [Lachnospira multipara]|uniref:exodeoxyribonuclease VII large subunit n=1 Tax=Lachnospira multipara TaxID=28051 RepID=UPI00048975D9|nr:exodeoxyribonuclease VII large subunit [Lachnospira multipara]